MAAKPKQSMGGAVKARRDALNMSQRDLAGAAGTTAAAISNIERGSRQPSADLVARIAGALGCSVDDLLTGTPPDKDSIYINQVVANMRSMPLRVQEELADYSAYLKRKKG